jgi:CTP:phosphocholine cytidylyltransferase-like protein
MDTIFGHIQRICISVEFDIFELMPETIELIVLLVSKNEFHFDYLKDRYPETFALFNDFFYFLQSVFEKAGRRNLSTSDISL